MRIDLIGGSGFIGTRLCRRLTAAGHDVRILDKAVSKAYPHLHVTCDICSVGELRASMREGTVVIHLAAEHRDDVRPLSLYEDVNVKGTANICDVAAERGVKCIAFTSSVAVYGFAPPGTGESGTIAPFHEYGRTKFEAEKALRAWQAAAPEERKVVIVRPTVVFGEQNRGNVYNLLRQIASGRFVMIGDGHNRKSMTYVENVAAFIEYALGFKTGVHTYNFIDKPDFTMDEFVRNVRRLLRQREDIRFRLPFPVGYAIGKGFDAVAAVTGKRFPISAIRVKKFCANSVYSTSVGDTGFRAPVDLSSALERTLRYEFLESHAGEDVFYTE